MIIMKKIFFFACLLVIVHESFAQKKSPDSLLRKVFNAVRQEDKQAFLQVFPKREHMKVLFAEKFAPDTKPPMRTAWCN